MSARFGQNLLRHGSRASMIRFAKLPAKTAIRSPRPPPILPTPPSSRQHTAIPQQSFLVRVRQQRLIKQTSIVRSNSFARRQTFIRLSQLNGARKIPAEFDFGRASTGDAKRVHATRGWACNRLSNTYWLAKQNI